MKIVSVFFGKKSDINYIEPVLTVRYIFSN